jgi:hypothetical protein
MFRQEIAGVPGRDIQFVTWKGSLSIEKYGIQSVLNIGYILICGLKVTRWYRQIQKCLFSIINKARTSFIKYVLMTCILRLVVW